MIKPFFLLVLLWASGCLLLNAETISLDFTGASDLTNVTTLDFTASGTGTFSPIGSSSLSVQGRINSTLTSGNGIFTFDFGSGNTLSGNFDVPAATFLPIVGSTGTASGIADVTSGTGLYAGFTGLIDLSGSALSTGPTSSTFSLEGTGTISGPAASSGGAAPEPGSFGFLLLGVAGAALFLRRRVSNV